MSKKTHSGLKIITLNRKASFNYFFSELFEAGIAVSYTHLTLPTNAADE